MLEKLIRGSIRGYRSFFHSFQCLPVGAHLDFVLLSFDGANKSVEKQKGTAILKEERDR